MSSKTIEDVHNRLSRACDMVHCRHVCSFSDVNEITDTLNDVRWCHFKPEDITTVLEMVENLIRMLLATPYSKVEGSFAWLTLASVDHDKVVSKSVQVLRSIYGVSDMLRVNVRLMNNMASRLPFLLVERHHLFSDNDWATHMIDIVRNNNHEMIDAANSSFAIQVLYKHLCQHVAYWRECSDRSDDCVNTKWLLEHMALAWNSARSGNPDVKRLKRDETIAIPSANAAVIGLFAELLILTQHCAFDGLTVWILSEPNNQMVKEVSRVLNTFYPLGQENSKRMNVMMRRMPFLLLESETAFVGEELVIFKRICEYMRIGSEFVLTEHVSDGVVLQHLYCHLAYWRATKDPQEDVIGTRVLLEYMGKHNYFISMPALIVKMIGLLTELMIVTRGCDMNGVAAYWKMTDVSCEIVKKVTVRTLHKLKPGDENKAERIAILITRLSHMVPFCLDEFTVEEFMCEMMKVVDCEYARVMSTVIVCAGSVVWMDTCDLFGLRLVKQWVDAVNDTETAFEVYNTYVSYHADKATQEKLKDEYEHELEECMTVKEMTALWVEMLESGEPSDSPYIRAFIRALKGE